MPAEFEQSDRITFTTMVAFTASSVRCKATPQAAEAPSVIMSNPPPEPRATVLLTWGGDGGTVPPPQNNIGREARSTTTVPT